MREVGAGSSTGVHVNNVAIAGAGSGRGAQSRGGLVGGRLAGGAWARARPRVLGVLGLALMLLIAGCDDQKVRMTRLAAAAQANRASGGVAIANSYRKDGDTIDLLMAMAAEKMEKGEDVTQLAGAILDATQILGKEIPQGDEFLIFWTRVGRLAFQAGLFAYQKGRLEESRDLVLAGTKRWQTEQYWLRYTDHDALASIVLYQSGEKQQAIQRLRERTVLDKDAEEAYQKLTGGRGE